MYLGDVAPFVEPANRLVARGHDVTYVVPTGFHDLLGGEHYYWRGPWNYVRLDPHVIPAHIFRITQQSE